MNEVNSDGISQNLTHLPMPHFNTLLCRTRSIIPTRLNSTSSFTSRFFFRSAHMIHIEHSRARNEASFGGIASLRLDYLPPRFASPRLNFQNLASPRFASSNSRIASLRLASDLRDQVAFIKFRVFFIIFDSMLSWYSPHIISRSSEIAFIKFGCKEKLENHYFGRVV